MTPTKVEEALAVLKATIPQIDSLVELHAGFQIGAAEWALTTITSALAEAEAAAKDRDEQIKFATDAAIEAQTALAAAEKDAGRYRWLRDSENCSLFIAHNDHHNMYESVEQTLDGFAGDPKADYYGDIPADERAKMIATDTIWTLHIYPNTPVGFNVYHAATLDTAIDAAMKDTDHAR